MENQFCIFCNCSKELRIKNAPLAEIQLRTLEAYNNNTRRVEGDNIFASVYSIKERACLSFHVINGLQPHLVFKGIVINVLSDIVGYFCKEKIG